MAAPVWIFTRSAPRHSGRAFGGVMRFSDIHPIIAGLAGSLIAGWLKTKWDRWVPATVGAKGRDLLLKENGRTVQVAKALIAVGLGLGLLCYWSGWLNDRDWRGLGIGLGLMSALPIGYMVVARARRGAEAVKECWVAFAISERTPTGLLFVLMSLMLIAGLISAASFLTS